VYNPPEEETDIVCRHPHATIIILSPCNSHDKNLMTGSLKLIREITRLIKCRVINLVHLIDHQFQILLSNINSEKFKGEVMDLKKVRFRFLNVALKRAGVFYGSKTAGQYIGVAL
jgi:hypothetical protein